MSNMITACFPLLFIGGLFVFVFIAYNNRMSRIRRQVREISAHFESTCPICDHDQVTWGVTQTVFFPKGQQMSWGLGSKPIIGFRCDNCGHLMFFTEPPAHIKRKRQEVAE